MAAKRPPAQMLTPLLLFLLVLNLAAFSSAASSSAFCKCTCFGNSTIIDLNGGGGGGGGTSMSATGDGKIERTCNDCTKKLCLDYHLPICKSARDEDVFTQCFWRDSAKDQAVVFIFIVATVGLLVYALVRPWVDKWRANVRDRSEYIPVSAGEQTL